MSSQSNSGKALDLAAIRAKLAPLGRKRFWQSLDELAETPEFTEFLHHEFPNAETDVPEGIDRRDVLKLMAASAAFAGLSACTKLPVEKIVPYVRPPEEIVPGKPLFYATSMLHDGAATGLLVESHMGRPTKIEGNPEHPGSMGATDIFAQASVLNLYDPDRAQVVIHEGRISDWGAFSTMVADARLNLKDKKGAGLCILTETVHSPSLAAQIRALLEEFPSARWHQYEPCGRDSAREGSRLAFGKYVNTLYRFDQADVILSLDADFLCSGPGHVRYAWDYSNRRRVASPSSKMNRLYVVESTPTNTGMMADHRLPIRAGEVEAFARALSVALGTPAGTAGSASSKVPAEWIRAVARDLSWHRGAGVIMAGEHQPPIVHALAHAMNWALANVGQTVIYTDPLEAFPVNELESLRELVADMRSGAVSLLIILGGNPVFNAPADLDFVTQLLRVKERVHLSLYNDETSELCNWQLPEAHFLESWGDSRAYDGTVGIIQPLIAPLYQGKSADEVLAILSGQPGQSGHDIIRGYWRSQRQAKETDKDFKNFWETTLHNGWMKGTALPPKPPLVHLGVPASSPVVPTENAGVLELVFRPDPALGDGRFANNGWLQELPKPFTKLTWDNPALVSPATAQQLGLNSGDVVRLTSNARQLLVPVWIAPGQADHSITLHLGNGRRRVGRVAVGAGFDSYVMRTSGAPWIAGDLHIDLTTDRYELAATQHHHLIDLEGQRAEEESLAAFRRDLVRVGTFDEFRRNPDFAKDPREESSKGLTLYPGFKDTGYSWGMAIDLNSCVGCNACVVACQAENNIPVVGKDQVARGREMHWIRVDTYFRGGLENPETYVEPVLCMHCENAPCEVVCPVGATVHSPEGLNVMVYNRCVGTRYCSNNCPYKVRRFNFKLFQDWTTPSLYGLRNPNVTVRSRGVMEKCTYCLQRINAAKIQAEEEDRQVRDGEIVTACQAVCPAQAIVFGNINDPNSRVSKLKAQSRNYALLDDLNARPRTTYLARLRNPNPEIAE